MNDKANLILSKLRTNGHSAFIVGGAVRDLLIGKEPKDFDIVSSAAPADIKEIFKGFQILEIGEAFGIVSVVIDGEPFEIAQMRKDSKGSDGRRPDFVTPVNSIGEDLARRDFTMNAIAMINEHEFIDPFGGSRDIEDKIIDFVGDAAERINEDKLRILRAFRFMSQLGFNFSIRTHKAIEKFFDNGGGFNSISQERITAEFNKILTGKNAFNTVRLLAEMKILEHIIPETYRLFEPHDNKWHTEELAPFGTAIISHVLHVFKAATEFECENVLALRLAALLHDIAKPVCRGQNKYGQSNFHGHDLKGAEITFCILTRMKFPNDLIDLVVSMVRHHMNMHDITKMKKDYKIRRLLGRKDFDMLLALGICDTTGTAAENGVPNHEEATKLLQTVVMLREKFPDMLPDPIITGKDLIFEGKKPGPEFKDILFKTHNFQLNGETDRNKLLKFAMGLFNNVG